MKRKKQTFQIKTCFLCKKEYLPTNGRQIVCKNCRKINSYKKQKEWIQKNRKRYNNNIHKYRLKNIEIVRLRDRLIKSKRDKNKVRKQQRDLYARNKERYREKSRIWKKNHLDKALIWNLNRYAKSKGIIRLGKHTVEEWLELKKKHNFTCVDCNKVEPEIKLTKDHVIPLTKWNEYIKKHKEINYGYNDIKNILPRCRSCNSSKYNHV